MHGQLTHGRSEITGVTGPQSIRAMVQGAHDPHTLAAYRHAPCATSEADMATAFTGHDRPEQLFARTQALEWYDCSQHQLTACDQAIAQTYAAFTPQVDLTAHP